MTTNMGTFDRMLRLIVGLALIVLPLVNMPAIWSSGLLAYGSVFVGLVMAVTSVVGFCPLYRVIGISTTKA